MRLAPESWLGPTLIVGLNGSRFENWDGHIPEPSQPLETCEQFNHWLQLFASSCNSPFAMTSSRRRILSSLLSLYLATWFSLTNKKWVKGNCVSIPSLILKMPHAFSLAPLNFCDQHKNRHWLVCWSQQENGDKRNTASPTTTAWSRATSQSQSRTGRNQMAIDTGATRNKRCFKLQRQRPNNFLSGLKVPSMVFCSPNLQTNLLVSFEMLGGNQLDI